MWLFFPALFAASPHSPGMRKIAIWKWKSQVLSFFFVVISALGSHVILWMVRLWVSGRTAATLHFWGWIQLKGWVPYLRRKAVVLVWMLGNDSCYISYQGVCVSRSWPSAGGHQSLQFIPGTAFQASSQLERGLCYTKFRHPGKHLGMDVCISVHIDSQGLSSLSPPESRDWDKDLHKDGLLKHWPKKQEWIQESQWEDVLLRWPCGQLSASRNVCTGHAEGHISPPALAKVALRAPLICISWMHLCVLRPTSGPQRSSRIEKMGVRHG